MVRSSRNRQACKPPPGDAGLGQTVGLHNSWFDPQSDVRNRLQHGLRDVFECVLGGQWIRRHNVAWPRAAESARRATTWTATSVPSSVIVM